MATFVYRCPTTGLNVQAWFADDPSGDKNEVYETVKCLACAQVHLINRLTGRVVGRRRRIVLTPPFLFWKLFPEITPGEMRHTTEAKWRAAIGEAAPGHRRNGEARCFNCLGAMGNSNPGQDAARRTAGGPFFGLFSRN